MTEYNKTAVEKAISSASRHGPKIQPGEATRIHRLLQGRHQPEPEPDNSVANSGAPPRGGSPAMTKERFVQGLARLGYNVSTAHRLLGMGRSTIYRMSNGTSAVPVVVAKLMDMYEKHGIPEEHH
jgi:hypothetical protein